MPKLFGIGAKPGLAPDGQKLVPLESCGVKVMSIGFLIEEGAPVIWRGPMVMSALNQLLREVVWGELDVLVVDMPPGTGDTQLTIAQNVPLAGAVIVSTPQDLALIDARRGIAMFGQVKVPLIGVVENMSYFLCPHCGGRTDVFSHGGARKEAEKLGVPFLGEVPLDIAIRANSDDGAPGGREHAGQPAGERAHRDRKTRGGHARGRRAGRQARAAHPRALEKDQAAMSWPTDITAMDKGRVLEVVFDDGGAIRLTAERLRVESPSAEVQGHSPSQKKTLTGKENVAIVGIEPVGNYAIKIIFDDGHDTGLYTWDYLAQAGDLEFVAFDGLRRRLARPGAPNRFAITSSRRARRGTEAGAQKPARTVPAISHWKPSSAFEILLTSFAFVRCRRAATIAAPTREATT